MESGVPNTSVPKPKLRWYQFSLRTLLIAVTLFAFPCSWLAVKINQARRQRIAVAAIVKEGGSVNYDWQFVNGQKEPRGPAWLRSIFGEDLFSNVLQASVKSDAGLACLTDLPKLQALSLARSQVTDDGLQQIEGLSQLQFLNLANTKITGRSLSHLKKLSRLQSLYLGNTPIADSDLAHLGPLTNLVVLYIDNTNISDAGLKYIEKLPNLTRLSAANTKIAADGVEKLKRALPKCEITP